MNWNYIESNWTQFKAAIQENWPRLTNEDIHIINGNRDLLATTIENKYNLNANDVQTDVDMWHKKLAEKCQSNSDSLDPKYNPDYSGSDSNLTHIVKGNASTGKLDNDANTQRSDSDHIEKSIDQT